MSTRATYEFSNVMLYDHYDGYPEGAAEKLTAMLENSQRGMAAGFIRGNENAEITDGHHGDTEWHYMIDGVGAGANLRVLKRRPGQEDWNLYSDGPLSEFIEMHSETHFVAFSDHGHLQTLTLSQAEATLDNMRRTLGIWASNGHTNSYNFTRKQESAQHLQDCIDKVRRAIREETIREEAA